MSESNERWDMILSQLQQAAVKAGTPARSGASLDHNDDGWPSWVPTSEFITVDGAETLLDVAS